MVSSMLIPGPAPTNTAQKVCDFVRASKAHVRFVLALAALLVLLAANVSGTEGITEGVAGGDGAPPVAGGTRSREPCSRAGPAVSGAVSVATRTSRPSASASEGEHADAHSLAPLMLA